MQRFVTVSAAVLVSLVCLATTAGAQQDLGNDGIDMDCDDFVEMNAAQGYFEFDGGSADRNVDGLDASGEGLACRDAVDRAGEDTASNGDVAALPGTGTGTIAGTGSLPFALLLLVGAAAASFFAASGLRRRG
jgi:hypothetical protein